MLAMSFMTQVIHKMIICLQIKIIDIYILTYEHCFIYIYLKNLKEHGFIMFVNI
jgi:hypothetical protein